MLEKLASALKNTTQKIAGALFLDKKLVDEICQELRRALLEADVDASIINRLIEKIKKEYTKIEGIEKRENLIKLIYDSITEIIGKEQHEFKINKKPFKIMLLGLYGCGKTTTAAKLAFYYMKRGFKTCIVGLDVHRPAAPEQLEQLARENNLVCFINKQEKDPEKIWLEFQGKIKKYDVIIIDTAGRDVLSKDLVKELESLHKKITPEKTILVMPADLGKIAKIQAQGFKNACNIDGVIVTRMDGTAKAGGALSSCSETQSPVFFITTGEKIRDIETFNPKAFVSRLLGMGDLTTLLEKVKLIVEKKQEKKFKSNIEKGKFSLEDFYEQIKAMQKMGPLSKIVELIPGLSTMKAKLPENVFDIQESKLKRWKFAIDSMTPDERENPDKLNSSRVARISKGSHTSITEIKEMLKQFKFIKELITGTLSQQKMMSQMQSGQLDQKTIIKLAKKMKGKFKVLRKI